jgi:hypothetical protein
VSAYSTNRRETGGPLIPHPPPKHIPSTLPRLTPPLHHLVALPPFHPSTTNSPPCIIPSPSSPLDDWGKAPTHEDPKDQFPVRPSCPGAELLEGFLTKEVLASKFLGLVYEDGAQPPPIDPVVNVVGDTLLGEGVYDGKNNCGGGGLGGGEGSVRSNRRETEGPRISLPPFHDSLRSSPFARRPSLTHLHYPPR